MYRRLIPVVALIVCATFAAPAQANFKVGIGDQDAAMFDNANFQSLKIKRIRYLVPFDWYKNAGQNAEVIGLHEPRRAAPAPTSSSTSRPVVVATTTAATRRRRSAARRA